MKKLFALSLIVFLIAACGHSESKDSGDLEKMFSKKLTLENQKQKASYTIGYNMGKQLRNVAGEIDLPIIIQGMMDGTAGDEKAQLETQEMQKVMMEFQAAMRQKYQDDMAKKGGKNKTEGEKFLEENAKKEGVKTTESGLQYKIITEGTGPSPQAEDVVKVHYKGTFLDGKEFDSSYSRNAPATFPLNRVIKGWSEALQMMKVGGKWILYIPPQIGYGEKGKGEIGPSATLIFEVELLGIEDLSQKEEPKKETK